MVDSIVLAAIGIVVGLAGGLFGIGGSIVLIPAVTEYLGPDQHRYQAAAMIVNLFVAAPAVIQHRRAKAIDVRTVYRLLPLAVVGVIAGVGLSETQIFAGAREPWLRLLFGLFVLLSALIELYRMSKPRAPVIREPGQDLGRPVRNWRVISGVALPTGLVAGLLGVGGGIVAVPLQRRLMHMPLREAIANSAAMLTVTSLIGGFVKNLAYLHDNPGTIDAFSLAAVVVPTAVAGSLVGSYLTHRISVSTLRAMFVLLLLIAAGRFMLGAARDLNLW